MSPLYAAGERQSPVDVPGKGGSTVTQVSRSPLVFNYDPRGKPDPFRPFVDEELALRKRQELRLKSKPVSPLLRYPLNHYRLVGVAVDDVKRVAVVQDNEGKFYPLSIGMLIGSNRGRVVDIREDRVVVEESTGIRKRGKPTFKRVTIKLKKEEVEP
ncbi:MAG: pilus assembly protein PilP [Syntrophales bacterium]|nr:pilus assembly protein PilP [Syntrophales bacterium]